MRSNFPLELAKLLAARQYGVGMLARVLTRAGRPVQKQFLHQIMHGDRPAPVKQIKNICVVLSCSDAEARRLWCAAARDEGYEI